MTTAGVALARIGLVAFCGVTALFAFVASSAFAYLQFIKPRVFHWVGVFADWHPWLFWIWFAVLVATVSVEIRQRAAVRTAVAGLVVFAAAIGLWNTVHPVLASLTDGPRSVMIGVGALVPVVWLALIDHLASADWLSSLRESSLEEDRRGVEGRLFTAAMGTALIVVLAYTAIASVSVGRSFEPDLLTGGLSVAVWSSLVDHLLLSAGVFLVLGLIARGLPGRVLWQYLALISVVACGVAAAFRGLVGAALGMAGPTLWLAAAGIGLSVAATWGGWSLRRSASTGTPLKCAIDLLIFPAGHGSANMRSVLSVGSILPLAYLSTLVASFMDWDFIVLNIGVLVVWVRAFVVVCRVTPLRPAVGSWTIGIACAAPLVAHAIFTPGPAANRALDRYAVHNASFRLAQAALRPRPETPSFGRFLRANTGLTDVTVPPIAIDLVPNLEPAPSPKPWVFLLVVDSLRSDYLAPYNPDVRFTPRLAEFADGNLVFSNAFTRYGGTGLSMPAIWAGSAIAHKQYPLPFSSMNALERVLDVNGYRRVMSRDHITAALWTARSTDVELDRGRVEMQFDLCGTLDELSGTLGVWASSDGAVFAQTRSLNLHVASARFGAVPPGKTYPGFEAPYAWRVERMDDCFGRFIDRLKQLGAYDRSLIILTADHGELIGEDGRWGHSYHLLPEVVQVPLLIHMPRAIETGSIDPQALSLSTDITPTIYDVLGYQPQQAGSLMGRSLLHMDDAGSTSRREEAHVIAASYGAVYAVVSGNGRQLYVADAIKDVDHAYARSASAWVEQPVSAGLRTAGQRRIRRHIDEIARVYRLNQRF